MSRAVLLSLALLLAGCNGAVLELDPRWHPLERIKESSLWPEGVATTIGDTVWTRSISALKAGHPGPEWEALLLHEQEHAKRQAEAGLLIWLAQYGRDPDFMWLEESRAWAIELDYLRRHGVDRRPEAVAEALSSYKTLIGNHRMIGYVDALKWARDVQAGRWRLP